MYGAYKFTIKTLLNELLWDGFELLTKKKKIERKESGDIVSLHKANRFPLVQIYSKWTIDYRKMFDIDFYSSMRK